jgi:hypothetical protein
MFGFGHDANDAITSLTTGCVCVNYNLTAYTRIQVRKLGHDCGQHLTEGLLCGFEHDAHNAKTEVVVAGVWVCGSGSGSGSEWVSETV